MLYDHPGSLRVLENHRKISKLHHQSTIRFLAMDFMRAHITSHLVKSLEPKERAYDVRDTQLKGFILRVQPRTGVKSFLVEYGRGRKYTLGRTDILSVKEARERAKIILGEVYNGGDPVLALRKAKAHTLETFVLEVYKPWAEAHLRTAHMTVNRLLYNFADYKNYRLGHINTWHIEKWRAQRLKKGLKASTLNRAIGALKTLLNRAVEWGFLEANPIVTVKLLREDPNITPRYLTKEEYFRLKQALNEREQKIRHGRESGNQWRAARNYTLKPTYGNMAFVDDVKPLVLLSLHTGARRGELFQLKWREVDLERRMMTVTGYYAKSGKTRHIPLNPIAFEVMRDWRSQAEDLAGQVFPSKDGKARQNIKRVWKTLLKSAEISEFRWHDMRHTFASWLVMAGVELNTVRELLGHADYTMTLRYAHLAPELKAEAVARIC